MTPCGGGGGGSGDGLPHEQDLAPSVHLARRRLLRLVSTLALNRLQQLDPLDLFRGAVPAGAKGYAGAMKFPVDFLTIRRRVQWDAYGSVLNLAADVRRMCTKPKVFNSAWSLSYATARCVRVRGVFFSRRLFGAVVEWG